MQIIKQNSSTILREINSLFIEENEMKNIFVAVIFLMGQFGYSAEKINQINAGGFHLENQKLSSLILTKEELNHLNDKDKAEYLFSLIALAQIIEGVQGDVMGYEDIKIQKSASSRSKSLNLFFGTISQANAIAFLAPLVGPVGSFILEAAASLAVWEGLRMAGSFVLKKVASRAAASVAEKAAFKEGVTKVAAAGILKKGSKEAIQAGENLVKAAATKMSKAEAALSANKNPKNKIPLLKDAMEAQRDLDIAKNAFVKGYGGDPKKLDKMINGSFIQRYITKANIAKLAAAGLIFHGADTLMKETVGSSLTDLAGAYASETTPPIDKKTIESKKEKGKSCIFGGHPSVWKDFGEAGVKCTRPSISKSDSCKGENQFLCASYGITLAEGSVDSELCIEKLPLDDLTIRCSSKFKETVTKKKATVNADKLDEYQGQLKEVIARLESEDEMRDEQGKTKSIAVYCKDGSVDQENECKAIMDVLAVLKQTGHPTIVAVRPSDAANAPAATTNSETDAAATKK